MQSLRFRILSGLAAVLAIYFVWQWIAGWGLVTVHEDDAPLSQVIRSIERQGGIRIVTNADVTQKVTLHVDRVPPATAVDALAGWMDANWSVGYAAAASKSEAQAAAVALTERRRDGDYVRFGGGFGGFGGGGGMVPEPIDVRRVSVKVSPLETSDLQSYADQIAQKSGLVVAVPQSWNPAVTKAPKDGTAAETVRGLVDSVGGKWQEVFVIRMSEESPVADAAAPRGPREFDGSGGSGPRGGPPGTDGGGAPRRQMRPEWVEERALAAIAQLPPAEREPAKKEFNEMRDFWRKMQTLPEAERRAAAEQFFNSPAIQERMMERMTRRDAQRSPEKRAERYRRYVDRKEQRKAAGQ